jgi:hypothetical protein
MAKWNRILKVTAKDFYATGSSTGSISNNKGATGFWISGSVYGDSVLTSQGGEALAVTEFQTDTVYEIGLSRVSGSSVVYLLYPDPSEIRN